MDVILQYGIIKKAFPFVQIFTLSRMHDRGTGLFYARKLYTLNIGAIDTQIIAIPHPVDSYAHLAPLH